MFGWFHCCIRLNCLLLGCTKVRIFVGRDKQIGRDLHLSEALSALAAKRVQRQVDAESSSQQDKPRIQADTEVDRRLAQRLTYLIDVRDL